MKFLIASDIHGSVDAAKEVLRCLVSEGAQKLIILGDLYYHGPRNPLPESYSPIGVAKLLNEIKHSLIVVKGNCDSEVDEMISEFKFCDYYKIKTAGKKIMFTHGHKVNIENPEKEVDILIYGHEHVGYIIKKSDVIFANCGSVSLPKNNSPKSYLVLDNNSIVLKDFYGRAIDSVKF